ncbi:MAG: cytochrome d ubiquinol oxidase subunit II [Bythopirellula sp.]|nr:cytochrome d ubiquinol oxidase subunit II [Bythopirellula sp.]
MDLNLIWFVLLGILLAGYAILDGFDLGVGILHPLARTDEERRLVMGSIGPIWDGNEVWLVTFGGALFAAFPEAYATIFSAFYTPFMLLLFCLIFRGVSLEFRNKVESQQWRRLWDFAFFGASLVATFLFGVTTANGLLGIPLDERGEFTGDIFDLLGPYPLLIGLLTVAMFALHGGLYLHMKTEGGIQRLFYRWIWHAWGLYLVLWNLATMYTLVEIPRATANFHEAPWALGVVVLNVLAMANIPRCIFNHRIGQAFLSSALGILCQVTLLGVAIFPNLVTASNDPEFSLTVYTAASSQKTLGIMLIIAFIGMPLVVTYTAVVYWTFRGKVSEDVYGH